MNQKLSQDLPFGEWLRQRRHILDLTQQELADQAGCARITLRRIESGALKPSKELAQILLEKLGIPESERAKWVLFARGTGEIPSTGTGELITSKAHLATFLFTDIEDSAKLWEIAPHQMRVALQEHHAILQDAIASSGGTVFQIVGDAFCAVFPTAPSAISAAMIAQTKLHQEPWDLPFPIRVRIGIHTGEAQPISNDSPAGGYASNQTLNRVARILQAGHGGQVLLSLATKELAKDSLPAQTELRDMGEHHLRNLIHPEQIFQLDIASLPSKFPSLKTLGSTRHNLPIPLTSFIGREKEIAEITHGFEKAHIVTLMGAGGTGKTRLSIQVARELLHEYPDGVWLVELAPLSDPSLLPRATALTLGLRDEPQRPVMDMVCDYLQKKKMLLLLDNCKHLVEACAQLADRILHSAPHVRILATSREPLGIPGEIIYQVPGLQLPDLTNLPAVDVLNQYEAIQLFLDRATAVLQNFSVTDENAPVIAQICHQLDGIPLAIELAATKVRALSLEQINKRLDDRFRLLTGGSRTILPRHQTLQAAMDWSYDLLSPAEQILFRRLSVFVNGWRLEAAEGICADENIKAEDVFSLLSQLINKSLVRMEEMQEEARYQFLETIRQYAHEKLVKSGESNLLRNHHLDYFLNLAETAAQYLLHPEQLNWLARLDADHDNLRAALEWALSKESPEPSLRLCAALGSFWYLRAYWLEGSKWLGSALSKSSADPGLAETSARVRALYQDASLAGELDDVERMKNSAESSLLLARKSDDARDTAIARMYLGVAFMRRGNYQDAIPLMEQSLTEFRELNDAYWEAHSFKFLTYLFEAQGQQERDEWSLQGLELARKAGERNNLADALLAHANSFFLSNRNDEATRYLEEADTYYKQMGLRTNETFLWLGRIAWINGDYENAKSYFLALQEHLGLSGEKKQKALISSHLGILASEQGDLFQAHIYLEEGLAIARELEDQGAVVLPLAALSKVFYVEENIEQFKQNYREGFSSATRPGVPLAVKTSLLLLVLNPLQYQSPKNSTKILGAIFNFERDHKQVIYPLSKRYYYQAEAHAREALGNAVFESVFVEGQKMSLEEALDLALRTLEEM